MKVIDTRVDCDLAGHTLLQAIDVKAIRSVSDTADVMTAIRGSTTLDRIYCCQALARTQANTDSVAPSGLTDVR